MSKRTIHAYPSFYGYTISYEYKEGDDLRGGFIEEIEMPAAPIGKYIELIPDFSEEKFRFVTKDIDEGEHFDSKLIRSEVDAIKLVLDDIIFGGGF